MEREFRKSLVDLLLSNEREEKGDINNESRNNTIEELLEKDGYLYKFKDSCLINASSFLLDEDERTVSITDYRGPDRPILVLPEKLGNNYVDSEYEPETMQSPRNIKYLVLEQPATISGLCFPLSDIKGIIALNRHDPDNPDEHKEWKQCTKEFIEARGCNIYDNFTPDDHESHFEIDFDTLISFFRHLSEHGTEKDMEYLLSKNMTIGDIYMEAIVGDDVGTVKRLESYGFPKYNEFKNNEIYFFKRIYEEVKHFQAKKIEEYFCECEKRG